MRADKYDSRDRYVTLRAIKNSGWTKKALYDYGVFR